MEVPGTLLNKAMLAQAIPTVGEKWVRFRRKLISDTFTLKGKSWHLVIGTRASISWPSLLILLPYKAICKTITSPTSASKMYSTISSLLGTTM